MQRTSLQQHRRDRSLTANGHENDEDLVLFQEMQKRERTAIHEPVTLPLHRRIPATAPPRAAGEDIFSSSDWDKHDYDWLMTPPVTPFLSSLKHAPFVNGFSLDGPVTVKNTPPAIAKVGSSRPKPHSRAEPSAQAARRSFDIHEPADLSMAHTTSTSSISRKSISAATCPSTPSRSTTCVSRPIARASTPSKSAAWTSSICSSTPTGRAASPANRSASLTRPSTPIKRSATPARVNNPSSASVKPLSSVNKTSSLPSKNVSSMCPSSPATKARMPAIHLAALPGIPQESPPNLRTSALDRPRSNPRGSLALKTSALATAVAKATQPQPADVGSRNRQTSSSPIVTRGRVSSGSLNGDKSLLRNGKPPEAAMVSISNGVGSKVVDKSMPPRKTSSLSQEKAHVVVNTPAKKPVLSTPPCGIKSTSLARESSGFGRNLSKKSLDMALRHMDIQGSTPNGFQSFMSNVPTSSLYSVKSRNSRGISNGRGNSTSSITSSPMATSSNASSEHSMSIVIDPESNGLGDETSSEMGSRASPVSQADPSMAVSNERKVSCWLGSPGYMDDNSADIMQIFEQELASLSGTESPLVSQPEGNIDFDDFILEHI